MTMTSTAATAIRWRADCGHMISGPMVVKQGWVGKLKSECAACYLNRFLEPDGQQGEEYRITRESLEAMEGPDLSHWHCWGDD